jgi:hypothetical protein
MERRGMQMNHLVALILAVSNLSYPVLQESHEIGNPKYGQSLAVYQYRPGILLRVERGPDGQPERMVLEPFALANEWGSIPTAPKSEVVEAMINDLVPAECRGARAPSYGIVNCSTLCALSYSYEYADIVYYYDLGTRPCPSWRLVIRLGAASAAPM